MTILEHVARLRAEWAAADPATEKSQKVFGTWAQLWATGTAWARGVFSINLVSGDVFWLRPRPRRAPIGKAAEMTGAGLAELVAKESDG